MNETYERNTQTPLEGKLMSTEDNKVHLVTVRVDEHLATAMKKAAARQYSSVSDVIRQSLCQSLRQNGLLPDET